MTVLEGERKALNLLGCSENVLVKMENILFSNSVIVLSYTTLKWIGILGRLLCQWVEVGEMLTVSLPKGYINVIWRLFRNLLYFKLIWYSLQCSS